MKTVQIDRKPYNVLQTEFQQTPNVYSTLFIIDRVGEFDRISLLVSEIAKTINCKTAVFGAPTHGGYIPLNASIENTIIVDCLLDHQQNMIANGGNCFTYVSDLDIINIKQPSILLVESYNSKYDSFIQNCNPIIFV